MSSLLVWGGVLPLVFWCQDRSVAALKCRTRPTSFIKYEARCCLPFLSLLESKVQGVYSRLARNRNDIGVATVLGFLGVLSLLVLVTILSYGILLRPDLAALRTPSMAGALAAIVGPWGAALISIGLLVSVLGNYLSWSLLAAEVMFSAARTHTMPNFLARQN